MNIGYTFQKVCDSGGAGVVEEEEEEEEAWASMRAGPLNSSGWT